MLFSEITPYVRYARYEMLDGDFRFHEAVPVDERLFYTVSGYGKIKVKDREYSMPPYSWLWIRAGVPYCLGTPEETVTYLALNFDLTRAAASRSLPVPPIPIERFREDMLLDAVSLEDVEALSEVLYLHEIPTLQPRLAEIVREFTQKLLYYDHKAGHLLAECLADALRQRMLGSLERTTEGTVDILAYVHAHFDCPLSNLSLGERFNYHPNYISQRIKQATGTSLHQYVIRLRMMHAVSLLDHTSLPIGEIAARCGFCDIAYFSQYFKKYFGITPSRYREGQQFLTELL